MHTFICSLFKHKHNQPKPVSLLSKDKREGMGSCVSFKRDFTFTLNDSSTPIWKVKHLFKSIRQTYLNSYRFHHFPIMQENEFVQGDEAGISINESKEQCQNQNKQAFTWQRYTIPSNSNIKFTLVHVMSSVSFLVKFSFRLILSMLHDTHLLSDHILRFHTLHICKPSLE